MFFLTSGVSQFAIIIRVLCGVNTKPKLSDQIEVNASEYENLDFASNTSKPDNERRIRHDRTIKTPSKS